MKNNAVQADNNLFLDAVYKAIDKKVANSRKDQDTQINMAKKAPDLSKPVSNEDVVEKDERPIFEFYRMGTFGSISSKIFDVDKRDDTDDKNSYIDNSDNKVYTKVKLL